jgi:RNA polymerase sigma factor (sigma-70 family)
MSNAPLGTVLRHIRKLAVCRKDNELPDGQLLNRFITLRDEAAFAVLLKRHRAMVLGVCRSVMRDPNDAEDAFQATFILLAQKASSIHRRESVSGWLYRVAYRLAIRAQASAARRRVQEKRAAVMPSADPLLDLNLRELRSVLHEELDRLPENYRTPLVLCYLEEKTQDEAARLLGWTKGTIIGRLQRGRELLRKRLHRRGLTLSAALFTAILALGSASAAVPEELTNATLRAALRVAAGQGTLAELVSAQTADLVQGANTIMFTSKTKVVTLLLLALSAGIAGLATMRHTVLAANSPEDAKVARTPQPGDLPAKVEAPKPEATQSITVSGQVLDPDGKPFAGARLYLSTLTPGERKASPWTPGGFKIEERAISDQYGRFQFRMPKANFYRSEYWEQSRLMAVAKGYGPDVATLYKGVKPDSLSLRLVKDLPVSGRILDADGKPVAGAKVRVASLSAFASESVDHVVDDVRTGVYSGDPKHGGEAGICGGDKFWIGALPGQPAEITTGADGRFRLTGVGRERHVRLHVEGPAIHHGYLVAVTRPMEPLVSPRTSLGILKLHGATFDYTSASSRPLRGVVRDKQTRKPVAGVRVSADNTTFTTRTDKEGRFEILGCPKSPRYNVGVTPGEGQPYFARNSGFDDTPGFEPLQTDIDLLPGIPLHGRVTDEVTKKPVTGATVAYYPVLTNPFAVHMAYNPLEGPSSTTTADDGSFRLPVLPGPGVLAVRCRSGHPYMPALLTRKEIDAFFKGKGVHAGTNDNAILVQQGANGMSVIGQTHYQSLALLNPEEKAKDLEQNLTVVPGRTLRGMVVDPKGKPARGVQLNGETLADGTFTLTNLNPRRTQELYFVHQAKGLGLSMEIPLGEDKPITVKLQPCGGATGRIVDPDGQPLANIPVWIGLVHTKTDKEGRFRVEGLVMGKKYEAIHPDRPRFPPYFGSFVIEPDKVKDLGDATMKTRGE